jgi:bifunctional DNA-binding transcriptional regulator/antitoxin component of YhaV-PrlF toxin-antitoxin module
VGNLLFPVKVCRADLIAFCSPRNQPNANRPALVANMRPASSAPPGAAKGEQVSEPDFGRPSNSGSRWPYGTPDEGPFCEDPDNDNQPYPELPELHHPSTAADDAGPWDSPQDSELSTDWPGDGVYTPAVVDQSWDDPSQRTPAAPRRRPQLHGYSAAASRSPLRRFSAAPPTRHDPATAQTVVAALALPPSPPAGQQPIRSLPLGSLDQLPRDASMMYDVARVDASGRVEIRDIIKILGWQSGDKLEMILTQGAIIIRPSSVGHFSLSRRPRIIIPLTARKRHTIEPGDHVLVAGAPNYDVLIVYPVQTLNEMIVHYHTTKAASELSGS